ncbi:MAG: putative signal transducing protein [Solirubrobacteraceae bacterium]
MDTRRLTTAGNEFEADMIRERLAEAGIAVLVEHDGNPRAGGIGPRDIYVDAAVFERAREALQDSRGEAAAQPESTGRAGERRELAPSEPPARPGLFDRLFGRNR